MIQIAQERDRLHEDLRSERDKADEQAKEILAVEDKLKASEHKLSSLHRQQEENKVSLDYSLVLIAKYEYSKPRFAAGSFIIKGTSLLRVLSGSNNYWGSGFKLERFIKKKIFVKSLPILNFKK